MPTTSQGIPTPSDAIKISQLAQAMRDGFDKVDALLPPGLAGGRLSAGPVPAKSNIDTWTGADRDGFWEVSTAALATAMTGLPGPWAGSLLKLPGFGVQIYAPYVVPAALWFRSLENVNTKVWGAWQKLASTATLRDLETAITAAGDAAEDARTRAEELDTANRKDWTAADKADHELILKLQADKWLKPTPGGAVDLDTFTESGFVGVISSASLNLPLTAQGVLEVFKFGSAITQRFTTYNARVQTHIRHRSGAGVWGAWADPGRIPMMLGNATYDLDTIVRPGPYDIVSGAVQNIPVPNLIGALEVLQVNRATIQRFTGWTTGEPRIFVRSSALDNVSWRPWFELPGATIITALQDEVTALTAKVMGLKPAGAAAAGYKSAALALNQPGGSSTEAIPAASVRWPVTLGVTARRARLHLRNWNWSVGTTADYVFTYKGAVSFTGLWAGPGNGKTFTAPPVQVLAPFTTDAAGGEYVSEWFAYDFAEDQQHLVSVGFTTAAGQTNYMGRGGCWRNTNPADAAALDPAADLSATCPFDIWLELEVPAATPILAGFGDSNTLGTGTTLPVHDSWLAQYCRTNRALPLFLANHGSAASSWAGPDAQKWNRFSNVAPADAAVYFLHQNDLSAGITLDVLKQRFTDTLAILRGRITPNVYAATITPGNKPTAVDTVRKDFNSWLKSRPAGLKDCFDFAAAVSDNDLTLRAADNFDGLHFKTTGHAKIAATLSARPVTPRVLTRREIARLLP